MEQDVGLRISRGHFQPEFFSESQVSFNIFPITECYDMQEYYDFRDKEMKR